MLFPTPHNADPFWAEAARTGLIGVGALVAETPELPFSLGVIYGELTRCDPRTFRDQGKQLVAARSDPNAIRDMTAVAKHRGWSIVVARGDATFRREAWLAGRSAGIEVRGYRPTERDIQDLDRRIDRRLAVETRSGRSREGEPVTEKAHRQDDDPGARSRLRVVEAVVRARIVEPSTQERIMAAARGRIAGWLERGARLDRFPADRTPPAAEPMRARERNRGR